MLYSIRKTILTIVGAAVFATSAWAQAANPLDPYKDQGEVDVAKAAGEEKDTQKKLDKLKEWEQKYPDSKLKDTRLQMTAGALLTQGSALLEVAKRAYGQSTPASVLDDGQKAAQQIVANMDRYFSDENKTALKASDEAWKTARHQFDETSHSVLGWIALARKDYSAAEAEFKKVLAQDATAAQISYWLGSSIIAQHNIARYSEGLYSIARALSITGATALPPAAQKQYGDYLLKAYAGYHGSDEDLDKLKASAATSVFPPADFHIKSVTEIEAEKFANQAEFDKAHPDLALWHKIRDALKSEQGDSYFQSAKGSVVPPDDIGHFKAKIVTVNDKDLVINVDNAGGDATLKFEKAINTKAINVGDAIEFKGVIDSFAKEPYILTLTVDDPKEDIKGLPDNAFSAAPVRKPPVKKAAPKKAVSK